MIILELIRSGCFSRKQSIDLLDGLDFDFLNALNTDDDANDPFQDVLLGYTGNHDHRYSFSELDNGLDPDIKQEHFRRNSLSDNIDNTHFQHHGGTIPKANGNELRNVVHEHTYLGHSTKNDADEIDISAYRNLALILQSKETYDYDAHDQVCFSYFWQ